MRFLHCFALQESQTFVPCNVIYYFFITGRKNRVSGGDWLAAVSCISVSAWINLFRPTIAEGMRISANAEMLWLRHHNQLLLTSSRLMYQCMNNFYQPTVAERMRASMQKFHALCITIEVESTHFRPGIKKILFTSLVIFLKTRSLLKTYNIMIFNCK